MPNYAVIENQKVSNIVVADLQFAGQHANWVECPDRVCIGWSYIDGNFIDTTPKPSEEELANAIRFRRNQLLEQSDWTQLRDTVSESVKWETYRQKLRDITNQPDFPFNVTWPVPPS